MLRHPLPIRIFHWTMTVTITVLVLTGLYYDNPLAEVHVPIRLIRLFHGGAGMILIANTIGQIVYYAFTGKYREVLFLPCDLVNLRSFLRYNLFITDGEPNFGRYNPGQKAFFTLWLLTIIVGSVTGLVLLFIDDTIWLQRTMPGLNTILAIKYLIAIVFACTVPIHVYLAFTTDMAKLQAMITGYVKEEPRRAKAVKEGP